MKTAIILLLVVSALLIGCTQQAPVAPSEPVTESAVISDDEALTEVDDSLLSEDEEIEIGEMI